MTIIALLPSVVGGTIHQSFAMVPLILLGISLHPEDKEALYAQG